MNAKPEKIASATTAMTADPIHTKRLPESGFEGIVQAEELSLITPKSQNDSITDMTEYVLPQHANALGTVFGGQIMAWVDLCAAICAQRHSGRMAVTAYVDDMKFEQPVKVGEVVRLRARLMATFRTSMEIEVVVEGEDSRTLRRWPCVRARLVFVAIDDQVKPTAVAPLALDTEEARLSQAEGEARRRARFDRVKPSA